MTFDSTSGRSKHSTVGPSLAAFGRQLYAAWKGIEGDERIWLSTLGLDRPSWSPQQLGFGTTSIGPGLAAAPEVAGFPGEVLYAAWKDAEDQTLWSAFTRGHDSGFPLIGPIPDAGTGPELP